MRRSGGHDGTVEFETTAPSPDALAHEPDRPTRDALDHDAAAQVVAAEVVLPCPDLDATVRFFVEGLGFRVELVSPAEDPRITVVSGHGARLRLERDASGDPGTVRVSCRAPQAIAAGALEVVAPNGTRVVFAAADPPYVLPSLAPSSVVTRLGDDPHFGVGRAGMGYRDLIPDRQGGRFIASHIRIAEAGPVPDYVHHHVIRFQMIYCARGWVRVVYEDQGEPFVLHAGDCVLQPPRIRHRVLEASAGLEVVEIGCPARHDTIADHDLALPTGVTDPDRDFGGQRFVRHQASTAVWMPWRVPGLECRDLGIGAATGGLAGARVARPIRGRSAADSPDRAAAHHQAELVFAFVLDGSLSLRRGGELDVLRAGDSVVVPAGLDVALEGWTDDLELLEVTLPDDVAWRATPSGSGPPASAWSA